MLVCDIDGTIAYNGEFSDGIKECIDKVEKDGIKFVIATGRTFLSASKVLKPLNIKNPIICYQGGTVQMPKTGEVLMQHILERNLALEILDYLKKEENIYPNVYINGNLHAEKETNGILRYVKIQNIPYRIVEDISTLEFKGVNKLLAITEDANQTIRIEKALKERYGDKIYCTRSTPFYCEICNPKVSKANAVKFLADMWGIRREEIMACGDEGNDIEMVKEAGIGIAMGNGNEELKKIADFVTDSVENDGVAKAVEKFIYAGKLS